MDVLPERGSQGCVARWAAGSADQRPEPASAGPPVTMRLGFRPLAAQPVGCSRARSASSLLSLEGNRHGASPDGLGHCPRQAVGTRPLQGRHCTRTTEQVLSSEGAQGLPQSGAMGCRGPLAQGQGPGLGQLPRSALWHPQPRSQGQLGSPNHPHSRPRPRALLPSPHLSSFSWSRSSRAPSSRSSRCRARSSPQSSSARPCPAGGGQAVSPRPGPLKVLHI